MFLRLVLCGFLALKLMAQQPAPALGASGSGEFAISGTVVDAVNGQPLAHVRVAIAPVTKRDAFTTLTTAEDGSFNFPGLAAGKYTLTGQRRGYLTQSFNQHDQFSSSIVVGRELESGNLVFRLQPEASISGTITDESGDVIRDAQVMLYVTGIAAGGQGARRRAQALSDDEGSYHFAHLAPGKYLLAVSARPWYAQHSSLYLPETSAQAGWGGLISTGGASNMFGSDTQETGNVPLDVAYPLTFYRDTIDPAEAAMITIARGEKAIANIHMHPVAALHLRMSAGNPDDAQQNPNGTYVMLQERLFDGTPISVPAVSRMVAPGVIEVAGMAPGHYNMQINSPGKDRTQVTSFREVDLTSSGDFDKNQGQQPVAVTARIQFDPPSAGLKQLGMQLSNKKTRQALNERISAEGQAEFKAVLPGSYEISLNTTNDAFVKSISATGSTVAGRTVEIKGPEPVKLVLVVAQGQGQVTGVALRSGKPFAGAMIVLVPADPVHNQILFRRDQSDSDGTFTLTAVPGKYTLLALENGWELEWSNPAMLKPYMALGESVVVEPRGKYEVKIGVQ